LFITVMLGSMDVYVAEEAAGALLSAEQIEKLKQIVGELE